jgi:GDP-4-dehydro-6-deoxy-D-mannose reductase
VRALVTGGNGFVGSWLVEHLAAEGDDVVVCQADITDFHQVHESISAAQPDAVYHLAARAAVGESWRIPEITTRVNTMGTLAVLDACHHLSASPRVLFVSSADVYGRTGHTEPITEVTATRPDSPYAGSKAAAEQIALQHVNGYGLPVVIARPFNHIGPGQSDSFLVSALAKRVAEAEITGTAVRVGNLTPKRDFTDVRDVVRAYRLLALDGTPGGVYNICSGAARSVQSIAERLVGAAKVRLDLVEDPDLLRPVDTPLLIGSATKLHDALGWSPERDLDTTLVEVLQWWRDRLPLAGDALN